MSQVAHGEELLAKVFDGAREGLRAELSRDQYEKRRHEFVFPRTSVWELLWKVQPWYPAYQDWKRA